MVNRYELDRIIARCEQDLHDIDRAIQRRKDQRAACEAELDRLYEKRENWKGDDGA